MTTVGLATWEGLPGLSADDQRLLAPLRDRGLQPVPVVWSESAPDAARLDLVVVRSTWDYHHRLAEFLAWIDRVGGRTRLWNPPATVRWNSDKRYLQELARRGVATIPTVWSSEFESVTRTLRDRGWDRGVLKPTVSASGYATELVRVDSPEANERTLTRLRTRGELMLQPFVDATLGPGERSLVFLAGRYSHAILRAPKFADRSTIGEGQAHQPSEVERRFADAVLATLKPVPLYARVDLVPLDDGPHLMELELVEPELYFRAGPGSAERLADAIAAQLS